MRSSYAWQGVRAKEDVETLTLPKLGSQAVSRQAPGKQHVTHFTGKAGIQMHFSSLYLRSGLADAHTGTVHSGPSPLRLYYLEEINRERTYMGKHSKEEREDALEIIDALEGLEDEESNTTSGD